MRRPFPYLATLLSTVALLGCTDDPLPAVPDAATPRPVDAHAAADAGVADAGVAAPNDGSLVGTDASTPSDGGAPEAGAGPSPYARPPARGIVVINSDYQTTSVSLFDPNGASLADDCLSSATTSPKLSLALSGDVAPASQPQATGELALIDRGNGVIDYVDPTTCAVTRQVDVKTGFNANPYDVLGLTARKAYVTRYEANGDANRTALAIGNDVLIIDPQAGTALGRIDLTPYALPAAGDKPTLPRADRVVLLGNRVYVSLNNLSADFKQAGPGVVVIIDPETDTVVGTILPPGLQNCGGLQALEDAQALVVTCQGPYSAGDAQVATSGIAYVDLSQPAPRVTVAPGSSFGRAIRGSAVSGRDLAFAITSGSFDNKVPDQLWVFGYSGAAPRKVFDGAEGFSLGTLLVAPAARLLVVDGSKQQPGLRVFDASNPAVPLTATIATSGVRKLPARAAAWY